MRVSPAVERFVKKNGATILTSVGAVGVVATSVLTAKATTKADYILEQAKAEKGEELTTLEKVNYTLPVYIPTILMGVGTITCIFGANILNKKHQASIISAYTLLDQTFKDYRNKVNELYGEDANDKVQEEMVNNKPRR